MGRKLHIETVQAAGLSQSHLRLWRAFRARRPELASPYFDPRYALAASQACPGAFIAILSQGDRIDGFWPLQRRGGLLQPLGAPLTDYSGIVARPDVRLDHRAAIRALGERRFRFSGLHALPSCLPPAIGAQAMVADLSNGFEAWLEGRREAGQGSFYKDKRRRRRLLEAEVGEISFDIASRDDEALAFILSRKRQQLVEAGQHDIFACGWTEALLRRLLDQPQDDFGARIATLRAGGRLIAAELGLLSGRAYHLWFPVYDPAFHAYSPGQLMTIETLRLLAARRVRRVDFGAGGEDYKKAFADPRETVFEGNILANPARDLLERTPALRRQRAKIERRLDRIAACETQPLERLRAYSRYLGVLVRRHSTI